MAENKDLFEAVCEGNKKRVKEIVQKEIDDGTAAEELLNDSMIPAMREMGNKFSENEIFVPEMLIAARAMQGGLDIIEPILVKSGHEGRGKVAIGTVKGDLHDIGKNLVGIMLKGAGYQVDDLGTNCDIKMFEKAVQNGAKVLLCSALLTTTMPYMKEIINNFKDNSDIKVIIGGAPVTQNFADSIKADGYGENANEAIEIVDSIFTT